MDLVASLGECRCIPETADDRYPACRCGLPCTLIFAAHIGTVDHLIAIDRVSVHHHAQRGINNALEADRNLAEVKIDVGHHFACLHGNGVEAEAVVVACEQVARQHLIARVVIGFVKDTVIEPCAVGAGGKRRGASHIVGNFIVPEEGLQRHVGGIGHRQIVAHGLACHDLRVAALGDADAETGRLIIGRELDDLTGIFQRHIMHGTTLSTEASGYTTKYSKTTETKVIGNLDRNDMSYVPPTTVKNGKTLTLANVEWQVTGTALVGEALVPAQYQAVATYSASSSYQAATGYVTTAEYHGTVTLEGVDSITYTVVYTGSEIVPEKTHIWDNGSIAAPLLIIAAVLICAGIAAAGLLLLRRRKNVYVYVPDSKPREYRLIAKFRVEPDSEVPAIDAGSLTLNPGDTVAVEVKKSLARHLAGRELTVSFPQSDYTYTIQASKHNDWHEFTVPAEEEQEAPV